MADNRTGLSPADIAESFRDRCGDGSVEWVYTPTQTRVLLDAADMLDENAKLRELVWDMGAAFIHGPCYRWCEFKEPCNGDKCQYRDRMRELGVEV